jgi:Flp pilus assembly protein TadD
MDPLVIQFDSRRNRRFTPAVLFMVSALGACSSTDATLNGAPSLDTARVALASGSAELSLNICNGLLTRRAHDAALLVCRGDALTALGRGSEAVSAYQDALSADRKSSAAKLGLGRLYLSSDPPRSEALFVDALTREPRNAQILNNLGIARDLQGRHADAQLAYGEAIAASPELRAPQVNLALSMAMSGRPGEAVRIMRPIGERQDATPRERHDLAAVLAMDGKRDEAARLLRTDLEGQQADEAISGFQALPAR